MTKEYDLFVIGAGSGGVRAARVASMAGASVAIAENYRFGGTCVIRGCIPKKLMYYASEYSHHLKHAVDYGWSIAPSVFNWSKFKCAMHREISRLSNIYRDNLLKAGVSLYEKNAYFIDNHHLQIGDEVIAAKTILIASGAQPETLDISGKELAITSNELFDLGELPTSVAIIGGGYIAVEIAAILHGLGVAVNIIHRRASFLRGFDDDLTSRLQQAYAARGINLYMNSHAISIEKAASGLMLTIENAQKQQILAVSHVIFATGRRPAVAELRPENIGLKLGSKGEVIVNQYAQSNIANIYAVGDVTNRLNLTPVAIREGHAFAQTCFANNPTTVDYENIPTAIFSQPPIATVGLSENAARQANIAYDVYEADFKPLHDTLVSDPARIFMKLLVGIDQQKVLGVHMIGEGSAELMQILAIAVKAGLKKSQFDQTIALHPTAAEEFVLMRQKRQ